MNSETRAKIKQWIKEKQVQVVELPVPAPKQAQTQPPEGETQPTSVATQPMEVVEPRPVLREELILGNNIEILKQFPDNTFTAIVTDPPYGLEFMGKEWDAPWRSDWQGGGGFSKPGIGERKTEWPSFSATSLYGGANPTCGTCGGRARGANKCSCETPNWKPIGKRRNPENEGLPDDVSTGMARQMQMFQEWSEAWAKEVLRVLKPGGHLLSFGGTRTYHRMVCGIEDAGFQIRDKIDEYCELDGYLAWVHGQGFPKSLNIGKQMEKMDRGCQQGKPDPESANAKLWEGYGTALKPAHEPIAVFGKDSEPLDPNVPFRYEAKASGKERNLGCEQLFWLVDTNGRTYAISKDDYDRMAAENEARKHEHGYHKHHIAEGNIWPTVKPLDLMRYLVRMVKMPGENNLILDPFMGSGTTIVACVLEGCGYVGIDMDEVAMRIATHRVAYAKKHGSEGYE